MSQAKRFKKSNSVESINDDLKQLIERLKESINECNEQLNKLDFDFNNPVDFIRDEFFEFKRIAQLNKEELAMSIKEENEIDLDLDESKLDPNVMAKLSKLDDECDELLEILNKNEKETIANVDSIKNNTKLTQEFVKLKRIVQNFVERVLKSAYLIAINQIKLKTTNNKLTSYKKRLSDIRTRFKLILFNDKILELKQHETSSTDIRLSYYLHCKKKIDYKNSIEIQSADLVDLKAYLKEAKMHTSFFCDLFEDGKYLIHFIRKHHLGGQMVIFDPIKKNVEKTICLDNYSVDGLKIGNNFIYLTSYIRSNEWRDRFILILSFDLELIAIRRVKNAHLSMSHFMEPHFCEMYNDKAIKILDSNFNLILHANYQSTNELEPFYLKDKCKYEFDYSNKKYYFYYYRDQCFLIMNSVGHLLKRIMFQCSYSEHFRLDFNNRVAQFDILNLSNKLFIYDQSGLEVIEIEFNKGLKLKRFGLLIDSKSRYILHSVDEQIFFTINP